MRLLLPFYDLSYFPAILATARICPATIIANPWSGPGSVMDASWAKCIRQLQSLTSTLVLGYVDDIQFPNDGPHGKGLKSSHPKTKQELESEITQYRRLYGINNIFLDDVRRPPLLSNIAALNPGTLPAFPVPDKTIIVTHESNGYLTSPHTKAIPTQYQAVIALKEPDYLRPLTLAHARGIGHFYASEQADGPKAYDRPARYLQDLAKVIAKF